MPRLLLFPALRRLLLPTADSQTLKPRDSALSSQVASILISSLQFKYTIVSRVIRKIGVGETGIFFFFTLPCFELFDLEQVS